MNRKVSISLLIYSLRSYLRVRWVPRPKAQLPLQAESVPSAPARNRFGLAPALVPGMQRLSRGRWYHDPASGHRGV